MIGNGMGGIDWQSLPFAVEYHGVRDVDALVIRLMAIKAHKPAKDR